MEAWEQVDDVIEDCLFSYNVQDFVQPPLMNLKLTGGRRNAALYPKESALKLSRSFYYSRTINALEGRREIFTQTLALFILGRGVGRKTFSFFFKLLI